MYASTESIVGDALRKTSAASTAGGGGGVDAAASAAGEGDRGGGSTLRGSAPRAADTVQSSIGPSAGGRLIASSISRCAQLGSPAADAGVSTPSGCCSARSGGATAALSVCCAESSD